MLEAARLLRDDERVYFIFIGEGEKRADVVAYISCNTLTNVRVFPFQPENMLPFTLPLGDISLVALDEGMEDLMVPSKVFSYLAAGSAVIAVANDSSELSDILAQADCGQRVAPRQPLALAEAIRRMVDDPARLAELRVNARTLAERHYSREAGIDAFASILVNAGLLPRQNSEEVIDGA
jgi:glycosyltransferase involved in cell wall biosynthesis